MRLLPLFSRSRALRAGAFASMKNRLPGHTVIALVLVCPASIAQWGQGSAPGGVTSFHRSDTDPHSILARANQRNGLVATRLRKPTSTQSQFSVVDTAVVFSTGDTTRHIYAFNANAKRTLDRKQTLSSNSWTDISRITNSYDASDNMLSELHEGFENGQWVNWWRFTWTYDANNNCMSAREETWDSGQWINYSLHSFAYDLNNNRLADVAQFWENGGWENSDRSSWTYDANNDILTEKYEAWDNGQWTNSELLTWTYDGNRNRLSERTELWDNLQSHWKNYTRDSCVYDHDNRLRFTQSDYWSGSQWTPLWRSTGTYDPHGNLVSTFREEDLPNGWQNSNRDTCVFDANGDKVSEMTQYWRDNLWQNSSRHTYTYDARRKMTSFLNEYWNNSTWIPGDWPPGERGPALFSVTDDAGNYYEFGHGYFFDLIRGSVTTGIAIGNIEVPARFAWSQNYPNPFNPTTVISGQCPVASVIRLVVYDVLGREVAVMADGRYAAGRYTFSFDGAKLASGVYFYRLTAGSFVSTKKMILTK
jgi:Secretion system C-terminal sorting domain